MFKILPYIFTVIITVSLVSNSGSGSKFLNLAGDTVISTEADSLLISEGKELYKAKCKKCHALYNPGDYKLKQWKKNLREMKYKAELTGDEYKKILAYLEKNCKK